VGSIARGPAIELWLIWVCWAYGVEPVAYSDLVPLGSHQGATHVLRRSGHHCRRLDRNRLGPARLEAQEYM